MTKKPAAALFALVSLCATGFAQSAYTFEVRLIPDGVPGSPGGPSAAHTYNIGDVPTGGLPTRVGFWLQARVAQTTGQNWGVTRVSPPAGSGTSFISVSDPVGATALSRGIVNAGGTVFGRGASYHNGGVPSGNTGNTAGNAPFPGGVGNENGGLDNGAGGVLNNRVYGFDSYVGAIRTDTDGDGDGDADDNGDGLPEQPWRVNGGSANASADGVPHPSDGTFAPWANIYRVWLDIGERDICRDIVLNFSVLVNGAIQASPTSPGGTSYAMQLAPGEVIAGTYIISCIPSPGAAAALLGLAGVAGLRRRR
ncbi:MAG TPA: hypothetical protein VFF65_03870 [Phycisphaerales bacterium]|nr:hypothetical protein [Phycisphaerales bacterium]